MFFVAKSKYNALVHQHSELVEKLSSTEVQLSILTNKWNELVREINAKGGQTFLNKARLDSDESKQSFSQDEIRCLLQLCHPDKHHGKDMAHRMTALLLSMKD